MGLQLQCPIRIQGPLCTCVWHFQRGKLCWAVSPLVRAGARPGPLLLLPPQAQAALYPHPSPYPPPPWPHHSNCWGEGKQGLWPLSPCLSKAASPSSHLRSSCKTLQRKREEMGAGEREKEWEAGCRRQMLRQPKGKEELSRSPHLGLTEVSP